MRTFPAKTIPSGWYQIGWSDDFPAGTSVPLSYFDTDLVAFRGEGGELHVLDGYCPHMGAHLGHGGVVEGDTIRCPYHGWQFDPEGTNVDIPYSRPDKMGNLRLGCWPVDEREGMVLVHYSPNGGPPTRKPVQQYDRIDGPSWLPVPSGTKVWREVPMAPQFAAENSVDAAHFRYVHKAGDVAELADFTSDESLFQGRMDMIFGGDRGGVTWATPTGPIEGHIYTETWGLGLLWSRLIAFDDLIYFLGITPITPTTADLRSSTWVAKTRSDGSELDEQTRDRWVKQQNAQVDADLRIWTTQTYIDKPPFARSEMTSLRAYRAWSKQFYETETEVALRPVEEATR